jgi:hypothetical protein
MIWSSEISRYLVLIPFTILVYDYALTFRLEVERFWGTRLTWGTILVYVNRYLTLLGTVPVLTEVLLTTTDPGKAAVCKPFYSWLLLPIHNFRSAMPPKSIINILRTHPCNKLLRMN